MMMVCGGLGGLFRVLGARATRAATWLGATAGFASMAIGLWWVGDVLRT
jgi:apolipoprotein N-acyltransferase